MYIFSKKINKIDLKLQEMEKKKKNNWMIKKIKENYNWIKNYNYFLNEFLIKKTVEKVKKVTKKEIEAKIPLPLDKKQYKKPKIMKTLKFSTKKIPYSIWTHHLLHDIELENTFLKSIPIYKQQQQRPGIYFTNHSKIYKVVNYINKKGNKLLNYIMGPVTLLENKDGINVDNMTNFLKIQPPTMYEYMKNIKII